MVSAPARPLRVSPPHRAAAENDEELVHPAVVAEASAGAELPLAFADGWCVVRTTEKLLPFLEPIEAACYPPDLHEGVAGYRRHLRRRPTAPSFVCLHRHTTKEEKWRAVGYVFTRLLPKRTANLLCRSSEDGDAAVEKDPTRRKAEEMAGGGDEMGSGGKDAGMDLTAKAHTSLFIHDMAVHPHFHGRGVAGTLWRHLLQAQGELQLQQMSLVAVHGAHSFWRRFGFMAVSRADLPRPTVAALEDYGDHAVFMERVE